MQLRRYMLGIALALSFYLLPTADGWSEGQVGEAVEGNSHKSIDKNNEVGLMIFTCQMRRV